MTTIKPYKIAVFSAKSYDRKYLMEAKERCSSNIVFTFHDFSLRSETASLAAEHHAVCVFVNDMLGDDVMEELHRLGVRAVLLRCAGFNNVSLAAARKLDIAVVNVPSYSPQAVAEFALTLLLTLNRGSHKAYNRAREGNFNLEGLLGRTVHGKSVGLIGTGRIGVAFARIMSGFGCRILAYDPFPSAEFEKYGEYVSRLEDMLPQCDFVSLHCPLTDDTKHIINRQTLGLMKSGAMLINTSRGALIDTRDAIDALKSRRLGGMALDVYEGESDLFYNDHSGDIIQDDSLMRLMTFHNVIVCGHQAFFTDEALSEIAQVTIHNAEDLVHGRPCPNMVNSEGNSHVKRESMPIRI